MQTLNCINCIGQCLRHSRGFQGMTLVVTAGIRVRERIEKEAGEKRKRGVDLTREDKGADGRALKERMKSPSTCLLPPSSPKSCYFPNMLCSSHIEYLAICEVFFHFRPFGCCSSPYMRCHFKPFYMYFDSSGFCNVPPPPESPP